MPKYMIDIDASEAYIVTSGPFGRKQFNKYKMLYEEIQKDISQYNGIRERIITTMQKMNMEDLPPTYAQSRGWISLEEAMDRIRRHIRDPR